MTDPLLGFQITSIGYLGIGGLWLALDHHADLCVLLMTKCSDTETMSTSIVH